MKNYGRIITKVTETPWLITESGLQTVLSIIDTRLNDGRLDIDEIERRITAANRDKEYNTYGARVDGAVGVLPISGPIFPKANLFTLMSGATSLEEFRSDFRAMMNDGSVDSIVLDVDSPGGTSDFVPEVASEIASAREQKPIYAIANNMAGSAAMWLASQATKLYATPSAQVGSIGVYCVHKDQSVKDTNDGNKFTFVKAGKYKAELNPHEPLSTDAESYLQEGVDELYEDFLNAVATGRNTSVDDVISNYGQGRLLSAKKAKRTTMIDGIMEMDQLVSELQSAPQPVSVSINGAQPVPATASAGDSVLHLEVAEWEHSEPGSGTPPIPRSDEDDRSGDRNRSGSRRDTPPINQDQLPGGGQSPPQASSQHGEEDNNNVMLNETALTALGLSADSSDEDISAAIISMNSQLTANQQIELKQQTFAQMFPEQAAELEAAREERFSSAAGKFADKHKFVTTGSGDDEKPTTVGLSAIALNVVEETHKAIASGDTAKALEMFDNCMTTLNSDAGRVEYGEAGSSRPITGEPTSEPSGDNDDEPVEDEENVTAAQASKLLSRRALQLQSAAGGSSKMSWGDAVSAAHKELPLAAAVYSKSLNNRG